MHRLLVAFTTYDGHTTTIAERIASTLRGNDCAVEMCDLARLRPVHESKVLAKDFVWHFVNPSLPEHQGDYVGLIWLQDFFESDGRSVLQETDGRHGRGLRGVEAWSVDRLFRQPTEARRP